MDISRADISRLIPPHVLCQYTQFVRFIVVESIQPDSFLNSQRGLVGKTLYLKIFSYHIHVLVTLLFLKYSPLISALASALVIDQHTSTPL